MRDHLSVSQVTLYLQCARKYRYRYVDEREPETRSPDLAFGSAVHSAIAWWEEERKTNPTVTVESALRTFRADWQAESSVGPIAYERRSADEYRQLGASLVGLYIARLAERPPPVSVESRFEVPLRRADGSPLDIPLVGYLDQVRDHCVVELKTVSRRTAASNWELQLAAYSYAYRETHGVTPSVEVIELVKTEEPALHIVPAYVGPENERWFLEVAVEAFDAMRLGAFPPAPGWWCSTCEYRRACRQRPAST
jgi:putative RecB family exonuclease